MMHKLTRRILATRLNQLIFGAKLDVRESWEKTPADYKKMVDFLNWFDRTNSVEEAVERGRIDWSYRFASGRFYANVEKNTAMEIGFGAGRLLMHAARDFKTAIGVDIHANYPMSEAFLASQGVNNARLLKRDKLALLPDNSVDFVYSFIVFQHFDGLDEVEFYLNHISRLLAPQGIAQIYYGKRNADGIEVTTADRFKLRDCSLFIAPETMREIVSSRFELMDYRDNLARDAVANTGESVQAMVAFRNRLA